MALRTATGTHRLYLTLAMVLLAAAGAYASYVWAKYNRLNDLNQRQLAKAVAELKSGIENAVGTLRRFHPQKQGDFCDFDRDQPYVRVVEPSCREILEKQGEPEVIADLTIKLKTISQPDAAVPQRRTQSEATFAIQIDAMLRELPFPESFSLIFVAGSQGQVLYEEAPAKQSWLDQLRWGERQFRDSGAGRFESATLRNLTNVFGDDGAPGWPHLQSMSGQTSLRLGGQFHELYLEPLTIDNETGKAEFVLGGSVPTVALVWRALAVDSYFLAISVLLLLVALLGFPFVKLLALDAHERFRLRDIMGLYMSTAALVALATLTIQAFDASLRWQREADEGLAHLGEGIEHAFVNEVTSIQRLARDYDRMISSRPDAKQKREPAKNWYDSGSQDIQAPENAYIIQASWMDPGGDQVWKITADPFTSLQNVSQRVYFQSVRDGYLFEAGDSSSCGHASCSFYIGPDRSVTDGKFYTFIALPSSIGKAALSSTVEKDNGGYVVNVTARLFSLSVPALPAGYGFALINRAGRVLYHSDSRLSLRENVFDELSARERARAIVYSGERRWVTSAYRERPHRLHFEPVSLQLDADKERAGFYVVTFRDVGFERSLAARAFLMTLFVTMIAFLLFIGGSLAIMAWVSAARGRHWSAWLWPHGGVVSVYKEISVVLSVLLLVTLVIKAAGGSEAWLVAAGVLAMGVAIVLYAFRTRTACVRHKLDSPIWHSTMFLLLLICAIVVPASAVFRVVMGHEYGRLIATERKWMEGLRTDLPIAFRSEMRAENRPLQMIERMVTLRKQGLENLRPPAPFDNVPEYAPSIMLRPFRWADSILPIEDDAAVRVRYADERSYMPRPSWLSLSSWGVIDLVCVLILLTWWMRWKALRLFFADQNTVPQPNSPPALLWGSCDKNERLILIRVVQDHVANPYQQSSVEHLIRRGLLTLNPDLQPCSPEFAQFIVEQKGQLQAELEQWETVDSGHSWRYARVILLTSTAGLVVFIIATQPGVQSGLAGVAGGIAGVLTAGLKLRDSVEGWLERRVKA